MLDQTAKTGAQQALDSLARAGAPPQLIDRISRDELDDMTQEAALAILESGATTPALQATVAKRGALRWLRRESRERRRLQRYIDRAKDLRRDGQVEGGNGGMDSLPPPASPTPPQSLVHAETLSLAVATLATVNDDDRRAVERVVMGGETLDDAARCEGVSRTTIVRRVERGLDAVRRGVEGRHRLGRGAGGGVSHPPLSAGPNGESNPSPFQ